jgi:hypothetical protein
MLRQVTGIAIPGVVELSRVREVEHVVGKDGGEPFGVEDLGVELASIPVNPSVRNAIDEPPLAMRFAGPSVCYPSIERPSQAVSSSSENVSGFAL